MEIFARVAEGIAMEIWPHDPAAPMPEPQPTPVQAFGQELGATFVPCGADVRQGWTYDGRAFAAPVPPPPTPVDLRAYAAAARYAKETGGIQVGNAPIATDRESQALITGMWAAAQINPNIQVQFKSAGGGFTTLVAGQIGAIASAVAAHVQACFSAEAQVDADITAGKVTITAEVDAAFAAVTA